MGTMEEKIARINELYHKSQETGLSEEEKLEQKQLRQDYIASIKSSINAQLENIDVVDENGNISNIKAYKKK